MNNVNAQLILVTGTTGYVGGRLVPRLLEAGYQVRCLVRDPARLQGRPWFEQVEVVQGDVLRPESLALALQDVDAGQLGPAGAGRPQGQIDVLVVGHHGLADPAAGKVRPDPVGAATHRRHHARPGRPEPAPARTPTR